MSLTTQQTLTVPTELGSFTYALHQAANIKHNYKDKLFMLTLLEDYLAEFVYFMYGKDSYHLIEFNVETYKGKFQDVADAYKLELTVKLVNTSKIKYSYNINVTRDAEELKYQLSEFTKSFTSLYKTTVGI